MQHQVLDVRRGVLPGVHAPPEFDTQCSRRRKREGVGVGMGG